MNSLIAIILKNVVLLVLIGVSLLFIFSINISYSEIKWLFASLGIIYFLASFFEAYQLSRINTSAIKFTYFTDGFLAKRFIKIIAFVCCGIVLYYSQSIIKYLAFVCFLLAVTELIITLWRYVKSLCFIAFDNSYIIICTNKLNTISAKQINKVEERHGLLYIVSQKNISFTIRLDMIKNNVDFKAAFYSWISSQNLSDKVITS